MPFNPPFDLRRLPQTARYLAGGRLRPLKRVLLSNQAQQLAGKNITRRPMGWNDFWPPYGHHTVYRNGHQARSRALRIKAMITLWKAHRANPKASVLLTADLWRSARKRG